MAQQNPMFVRLQQSLFEVLTMNIPKIPLFLQINEVITKDPSTIPPFANLLKKAMADSDSPESLLQILEFIDFSTCHSPRELHREYNKIEFLKTLNSLSQKKNLSGAVKLKFLQVVQFLSKSFDRQKDGLANFEWYYQKILSRGIPFPAFEISKYLQQPEQLKSIETVQEQPAKKQINSLEEYVESLSLRQRALNKDFQVVNDNVKLANEMIDSGEGEVLLSILPSLISMNKKLLLLTDKLFKAKSDFLHTFALNLIQDIENSLERYKWWKSGQQIARFESFTDKFLKNKKLEFAGEVNEFGDQKTQSLGFKKQKSDQTNEAFKNPFSSTVNHPSQGFEIKQTEALKNERASFGDFYARQPSQQLSVANAFRENENRGVLKPSNSDIVSDGFGSNVARHESLNDTRNNSFVGNTSEFGFDFEIKNKPINEFKFDESAFLKDSVTFKNSVATNDAGVLASNEFVPGQFTPFPKNNLPQKQVQMEVDFLGLSFENPVQQKTQTEIKNPKLENNKFDFVNFGFVQSLGNGSQIVDNNQTVGFTAQDQIRFAN